MSKRRNENGQMRREEYEAADDNDYAGEGGSLDGGFTRASDEAIRARKIVKARPLGPKKAPTANGVAPAPVPAAVPSAASKANAFAGFSGLTAAKEPAVRANPFAGFGGLTAQAPAPPTTATASSCSVAAAAVSKTPTNYQEAIEVLNKEFLEFVTAQLQKNPAADWTGGVKDYVKHAHEIATKFAASKPVPVAAAPTVKTTAPAPMATTLPSFLNAAVKPADKPVSSGFSFGAKPMAKQEAPAKSSSPFADSKLATVASSGLSFPAAPKAAKETPATSGFSFSAKPAEEEEKPVAKPAFSFGSTMASPNEPMPAVTPAFTFGSAPVAEAKLAASGFSFGSGPASSATSTTATAPSSSFSFSFAKLAASASTASSGFSFGTAPSTAPATGTGGFTSGGATPAAPAATSAAPAADDEDDENVGREAATVILKAANMDEECVFEAEKAKVLEFKKDEKRWADKGTHPLKVLVHSTTKDARILIRNEIGKIVLNSALYKGMAVKPQETKGKKSGALLALQVDGSVTQFILKVNSEKVDAFIAALEQATPK